MPGEQLVYRSRPVWLRRLLPVRVPGAWDPTVVLVLTDGREQRTPYPTDLAEEIAALGAVPLR